MGQPSMSLSGLIWLNQAISGKITYIVQNSAFLILFRLYSLYVGEFYKEWVLQGLAQWLAKHLCMSL